MVYEVLLQTIDPARRDEYVDVFREAFRGANFAVRFAVTDGNKEIPVAYSGALPDLFREGQGVVAEGAIDGTGVFEADTILAKHDENYMPPEAGQAIDKAKHAREAAKTVIDN